MLPRTPRLEKKENAEVGYVAKKLITAVFKGKLFFNNDTNYSYEDLLLSNLYGNYQSKGEPETIDIPAIETWESLEQRKIFNILIYSLQRAKN